MRNNINLVMLRLFLRVAATTSFSEASRLENVSQPALSRTIRLLEDQLGVRLFDRDTRNVRLTASGEELLPIAERLIVDYDIAFGELAQTFQGQRGRVVLGALPSAAAVILPQIVAQFHQKRPHVEVIVRDDLSDLLLQQLEDRRIDFAVTIEPEACDRLHFEHLLSDDFVVVFRPGDAFDQEGSLRWEELEGRPLISMAPQSSVRRMADAVLAKVGISAKPLYECAHLATVGGLIMAGLGVSVLPRLALPMVGASPIKARPLVSPHVSRSIGIVSLSRRSVTPTAQTLMDMLRSAARTPGAWVLP